jgi:hypothetical protein
MGDLNGFLTYDPKRGLDSIGPEFLNDFSLLSAKLFRQFKLKITLDDFQSKSLEHVCKSLKGHYDPTRSISTFIYSILWQEAYDINKSMRRESFDSAEDILVVTNPESSTDSVVIPKDLDIDFRRGLFKLAHIFYRKGIMLNQDKIYLDFLSGLSTPIVNAILWQYVIDLNEITPSEDVLYDILEGIAKEINIDFHVLLSLYAVLDEDLFFVLDVLKGHKLSIAKTFIIENPGKS